MISLIRNNGFKWYKYGKIYAKGYIYIDGNTIQGIELCYFLKNIMKMKNIEKIKEINGLFSCIIKYETKIILVSDRVASFPLFYSADGKYVSDSVDEIIRLKNEELHLNNNNVIELIASNYISGNETVYNEVKIVDAAQYIIIEKNKIESNYYFKHIHSYTNIREYIELEKEFDKKSEKIFDNLISSLNGKTAVIPLSGGYDSRYVVCMLKKKGYNNVICYTYGDYNTYEVQYSKQVAKALNYRWYFIEYTDKEWKNLFDKEFERYCELVHNYNSIPNIQDYIALKRLKERKIIDKDCVIINGFCGDLPAGSFLLQENEENLIDLSKEGIINYIYKENYRQIKVKDEYKVKIKNKIKNYVESLRININNKEEFMNIYEEWITVSRVTKWIVNTVRIYEFFDMEWRMPLWDNEFIKFFYNLDYKNRQDCKFYKEYLFNKIFIPYNVNFEKPKFIQNVHSKSKISLIKKYILYILNHIRILTGKVIIKRYDVNNYKKFSLILAKKIKNKKMINYNFINAHQMMAIWWGEKKYGANTIKSIWKGSSKK